MRDERGRPSGFSTPRLASHFWRMVLTSGTRPLRIVTLFGVFLGVVAVAMTGWVVWGKVTGQVPIQGWASVMVILLVTSGGILFSLGILAEYLGVAARAAMGKPLFLVVNDPGAGPLSRAPRTPAQNRSDDPSRPAEPAARREGWRESLLDRRAAASLRRSVRSGRPGRMRLAAIPLRPTTRRAC